MTVPASVTKDLMRMSQESLRYLADDHRKMRRRHFAGGLAFGATVTTGALLASGLAVSAPALAGFAAGACLSTAAGIVAVLLAARRP